MTDRRDNSYQNQVVGSLQQLLDRFDRIEQKLDSLLADMASHRETQAGLKVEVCNLEKRVASLETHRWQIVMGVMATLATLIGKIFYDLMRR